MGIHKQSKRQAVSTVRKATMIAKGLPVSDLILRVVFVMIPSLIGAANGNDSVTIAMIFLHKAYSCIKTLVLGFVLANSIHIAIGTLEATWKRKSYNTGSTDTQLRNFKTKRKSLCTSSTSGW